MSAHDDRGEFSRRAAAEVARLTADGCAGHHDKLAAVWREARRAQAAAARVRDLDAARTAAAELAAVAVLSPHSLKIGVASRSTWRARSRRVRLLARLGLAFLPKLTRELEPLAMASDVFAGRLTFATLAEDPLLALSPAWTQPTLARLASGDVAHVCGARALHVRADVPDDERERRLAWAVASVAIEAVRGRVWGVGPTLEHDAAELLAAKLVARCARRSKVRAVPGSSSSTPGTTTAKGGGPRPRRSPTTPRPGGRAAAHTRPVRAWGLAGVARGLVALALALVVALVVGEAPAYAAQENAPIGWRAVGADRHEGKLEMAKGKGTTGGTKKGRPKAKAMAKGRARLRLGPEEYVRTVPATWAEAEREGAKKSGPVYEADLRRSKEREAAAVSGELVVDLPASVLLTSDGIEPLRLPERYEHPLVSKLAALSCEFLNFAREHLNDEAAAVGEILSAVACTVEQRDLGATAEPHAWARKRLARMSTGDALVDPTGQEIPLNSGRSLPFAQDAAGRRVSMSQISGGFAIVEKLVGALLEVRPHDAPREIGHGSDAVDMIARCMRSNLPALKSLRDDEAIVRERVRANLGPLAAKHSLDARAAELVTEGLVTAECELSQVAPSVALAFLGKRDA